MFPFLEIKPHVIIVSLAPADHRRLRARDAVYLHTSLVPLLVPIHLPNNRPGDVENVDPDLLSVYVADTGHSGSREDTVDLEASAVPVHMGVVTLLHERPLHILEVNTGASQYCLCCSGVFDPPNTRVRHFETSASDSRTGHCIP